MRNRTGNLTRTAYAASTTNSCVIQNMDKCAGCESTLVLTQTIGWSLYDSLAKWYQKDRLNSFAIRLFGGLFLLVLNYDAFLFSVLRTKQKRLRQHCMMKYLIRAVILSVLVMASVIASKQRMYLLCTFLLASVLDTSGWECPTSTQSMYSK